MSYLFGRLILIGIIASLPACAIVNDFKAYKDESGVQLSGLHSSSDFSVAWDTTQTGNDTVIDGFIKNVQNKQVGNINLSIEVLDSEGRQLSQEDALLPQNKLKTNKSFAFSVKLKDVRITEGNVLKFFISYHTISGAWGGSSGNSSFKVDATTGIAIKEKGAKKSRQG